MDLLLADSLFEIVSLVALILLSAAVGAGAMLFVVLGSPAKKTKVPATPSFAPSRFKRRAFQAVTSIRTRLKFARSTFQQFFRDVGQHATARFVSLIPSRQLVFRFACAAIGIALMIYSGFGFTKDAILTGFIGMTRGYAMVAAVWLLPGKSADRPANGRRVARSKLSSDMLPHAVSVLQERQLVEQVVTPSVELGFAAAGDWRHVDYVHTRLESMSAESSRLLKCGCCKKQFSVRGEGELAVRLVPCPNCGTALQSDGQQPSRSRNEVAWTPIISVYCRQCHGLIDVPYALIGTSTCCPRCTANLLVPDTENRVRELRQLSQLARA